MPNDISPKVLARLSDALVVNQITPRDLSDISLPVDLSGRKERQKNREYQLISDGSVPLDNHRHEGFLRARVEGMSITDAYIKWISAKSSRKSAAEQGSKLIKGERMQRRWRFLIQEARREADQQAKNKTRNGELTKRDIIASLEEIIKRSGNEANRMSAIDKLAKLKGFIRPENRAERPDPAFLAAFLAQAEADNTDPVTLAQRLQSGEMAEQGGFDTDPVSGDFDADFDADFDGGTQDVVGDGGEE